jgi:hypothetical protein
MAMSEVNLRVAISYIASLYDEFRILSAGSPNFSKGSAEVTPLTLSQWQTQYINPIFATSDWGDKETAALESSRQVIAAFLNTAPNVYRWLLRDYGQIVSAPETDTPRIFGRVYDDWVTNTKRIASRGFTFGASSAGGSNAGNGVVVRLNLDRNGFVLENQTADAKNSKCLFDSNNGASRWEEVFEIRGAVAAKDNLTITGSGKVGSITAISARTSANLVKNPSFSSTTPSGPSTSLTSIANWTSNVTIGHTYYDSIGGTGVNGYYRDFVGDTVPLALRWNAGGDSTLSQNLETNRTAFSFDVPYLVQIAWRRKASATGTLTFSLGSKSVSVDISTGSNDVWNTLRFTGTACWFQNFDQAGLSISVATTSLAVGQVDVDDILVAPMTAFDGSWYAYVGTPATGNPAQWLVNDTFSWTDSELGEGYGIIQKMFCWRGFGRYLPAVPAAPTNTLSAALAGAGAGNVDNGLHNYIVTFIDKVSGLDSPAYGGPSSATVADKTTNGKVSLSSIPTGPSNIGSRKIYRSKVGAPTTYYLLTTIADNSTSTYTDNTADASLGAVASAFIVGGAMTILEPA